MEKDELQQDQAEEVVEDTDDESVDEQSADESEDSEDSEDKDWKAEAAKYKAMAERRKEQLEAAKDKPKEEPAKTAKETSKETDLPIRQVLQLRKDGFSDEEILDLTDQANTLGVSVDKLLTNDMFKSGLESMRSKRKAEQATPSPSRRLSTFSNKKTWDKMSAAERKAHWGEVARKVTSKGGNAE